MEWILFGLPAVIWGVLRFVLPNSAWEFDFDVAHSTFFLLYDRLFKIAAGVMVGGFGLALYGAKQGVPVAAVSTCLFSGIYALSFALWTLYCYQRYLHARYPRSGAAGVSTYTTAQYALTNALGFSAVALFVAGAVMTVMWI